MSNPYDDIINLPHHVSATRPPMSMTDRAAQFSPFAALTGYDNAIKETGRLTDEKVDLSDEAYELLNQKFQQISEHLDEHCEVRLLYFVPDAHKEGGAYRSLTGTIKRIDANERVIIMQDRTKVPMDDVVGIDNTVKEDEWQ